MSERNPYYYSTMHWNLASYLAHAGFEIISANPVTAERYMFVFADNGKKAKEAADRFFSTEGVLVDARGVLEAGKYLRRAAKEAKIRMGLAIR